MGDNRNSIRKCGEKMRMVLLVGLRFYKQAPVYAARWIVERRIWESKAILRLFPGIYTLCRTHGGMPELTFI